MARKKKSRQAPISSHPVFPAVVALWFAALLGLGSLVLPSILFEKAVTATGIASLVPAAQPPLGATARLTIAVVAAVLGMIVGLFVARKVASAQGNTKPAQRRAKHVAEDDGYDDEFEDDYDHEYDQPAKKPISALEELGEEGLDQPIEDASNDQKPNYTGRRRALAVTDDSGPSDFFDHAPLPGGDVVFDSVGGAGDEFDALELDTLADASADDVAPEAPAPSPFESLAADIDDEYRQPQADAAMPFAQPEPVDSSPQSFAEPADAAVTVNSPPDIPAAFTAETTQTTAAAPMPQQEPTEMNPFAPPSSNAGQNPFADRAADVEAEPAPFAAPQPQAAMPPAEAPAAAPAPFAAPASPGVPLANRPLKELGMAELVERFAHALQKNGAPTDTAITAAHMPQPASAEAEMPAPQALAAQPVGPAQQAPAPIPAPATAPAEAAPAAPAPMVFRRSNGNPGEEVSPAAAPQPAQMPEAATAAAATQAQPQAVTEPSAPSIPAALQPLGFDDNDDDGEEENYGVTGLSLSLQHKPAPFSPPTSPPAETPASQPAVPQAFTPQPAQSAPAPFAQPTAMVEDEAGEEQENTDAGYSSLLNMKSGFASSDEFVRIEDDEDDDGSVQPMVVFPGQNERHAAPAADGPARDPMPVEDSGVRPFEAPQAVATPKPVNGQPQGNSDETERALREALEKLQRMSG